MQRRDFVMLLGGAAVGWPLAGRAQQPGGMRRIGVLINDAADDPDGAVLLTAFAQGLQELGWSVGRNIRIDYRWTSGDADRIRKYTAELIALTPDVILAEGGTQVGPLQQATHTVPIVFVQVADAVGGGFVDSLARPGGNATGFTNFEYGFGGKWLELLKQIAPAVTRAAVLRDSANPAGRHSAVVQALIDDLIARGLDPAVPRLFIIDGAKALAKAIRRSFGRHTPIQRCQIHKARNIMERLSPALHASVRRALRQAWELDDADKAEKLIRNLAQRLERDAPGVSKSILEGLDEILTVSRLGLPAELRRSLACTNIIENMMGTVRRVTRNVKRWSSASMALRWTAAAMLEAKKGFRRLKAYKQLPALRVALNAHYERTSNKESLAQQAKAA